MSRAFPIASDWTAAGTTLRHDYSADVSLPRIEVQERADLIDPLPPSPAGELLPLTWISRLGGKQKWNPPVPWAFLTAMLITLLTLLVCLRGLR